MKFTQRIILHFFITLTKTVILLVIDNIFVEASSKNLIINGNFEMSSFTGSYHDFSGVIPGWTCTNICEVDDCLLLNQFWISIGSYSANCTGRAIDTIASNPENITQVLTLSAGHYLLSFNYYYPRTNAQSKTFKVFFNQKSVLNVTPIVSTCYLPFYFQQLVEANDGKNTIRLTTVRISGSDAFGFSFNNVSLIQHSDELMQFVNKSLVNQITVTLIQTPGSRIFFGDVMSFFVNFDRLQFYYYHHRNYSEYSNVLLEEINTLNNLKGSLFLNFYEAFSSNISNRIDTFFQTLDYKYRYSSDITLGRNVNGGGFVNNCYSVFVFSIPGAIFIYIVMLLLFKAWKNRPISRLFRKYSFYGLLFPFIFEGNIESLTYYSIGQFQLLFSANNQHKIINIFIIFFFFFIIVLSVGSIYWFKSYYRRKICYFLENKRCNSLGIWCQMIDTGIVCIIFGIVHQVMYSSPNSQLFVLFIIEVIWMSAKLFFVITRTYKTIGPQFILILSGLNRLCFIITFYFYQNSQEQKDMINKKIQKVLIINFFLLWLKEFIISMFHLLQFLRKLKRKFVDGPQTELKHKDQCPSNPVIITTNKGILKIEQIIERVKSNHGTLIPYKIVEKKRCNRIRESSIENPKIGKKTYKQRVANIVKFQQNINIQ